MDTSGFGLVDMLSFTLEFERSIAAMILVGRDMRRSVVDQFREFESLRG